MFKQMRSGSVLLTKYSLTNQDLKLNNPQELVCHKIQPNQGHMAQWIKRWFDPATYSKSVSSIPGEGSGELSEGKLTGDN